MRLLFTLCCAGIFLFSWSQTQPLINYAAGWGELEIDLENDGDADNWGITYDPNFGQSQVQASFAIDRSVYNSGRGSQRITLSRAGDGVATSLRFWSSPITSVSEHYPQPGERVFVTLSYQASNLQNVSYTIRAEFSGAPPLVLISSDQNQGTWQTVEGNFVMPSAGFRLSLVLSAGTGPVSGTVWIDGLRITTSRRLPLRQPSSLKLHNRNLSDDPDPILTAAYYELVVVEKPWEAAYLKELNPNQKILFVARGWFPMFYRQPDGTLIPNNLIGRTGDFFPCTWVEANRPEWFLVDSNGNRIPLEYEGMDDSSVGYMVDYGNDECRNLVYTNFLDWYRRVFGGNPALQPYGYYLDSGTTCVRSPSTQYPTETQRAAAALGWYQGYHQRVRSTVPIIVNTGSTMITRPPYNGDWLPYIDGYQKEHFLASHSDGTFHRPAKMAQQLREVIEHQDKILLLHNPYYPDDPDKTTFMVASFYIVNNPNVYVSLRAIPRGFAGQLTPELFLPLGRPTTTQFEILAGTEDNNGALYLRRYQNGVALLNTSETQTFSYTPSRRYKDSRGNLYPANTPISIRPQKALILYAAAEVEISISADQTTVMPGGEVTYTVRYQNRGLLAASNLLVRVPLVERVMQVVQMPTGAQVQDGVLVYPVSSLPAGSSGEFQFRVRIQ